MLALHVDTAAGLSYRNRGGQRPPVFFALVSLRSCSFLAAQVGVGTMQLRAGLGGGEGEERKSSRPPERAGWMGTGVAPGVRHNPVFGSPGEEFPPPAPQPPSLTNTQFPGARGTSWGP